MNDIVERVCCLAERMDIKILVAMKAFEERGAELQINVRTRKIKMGFQLNELCKDNGAVWRRPLMMYAELFSMNHFEMESSSLLSCIYWRNKSFPTFFCFPSILASIFAY